MTGHCLVRVLSSSKPPPQDRRPTPAFDHSGGPSDDDGVPYYASDGVCDDGGPGAKYSACAFGALCAGSNLCHPSP